MKREHGNILNGISNDDMVCKDCKHKLDDSVMRGNASKCKRFDIKPVRVFLGGNCLEHERGDK